MKNLTNDIKKNHLYKIDKIKILREKGIQYIKNVCAKNPTGDIKEKSIGEAKIRVKYKAH